ncbi:MAG: sensor histidine kinase [Opitutaceae bacterium]
MKQLFSPKYRWAWLVSLLLLTTCLLISVSGYWMAHANISNTILQSSSYDSSELESALLQPLQSQLLISLAVSLLVTSVVASISFRITKSHNAESQTHHVELSQSNQDLVKQTENYRQAVKELEAVNKEKDEFVSIVAHDLKNPLSSIIGFSQLAQMENSGIELQAFARDVNTCGERMLELTQKLLEVSKIESFNGELVTEEVNWNERIEASASSFKHQTAQKHISLNLNLAATDGTSIKSNPDWLDVCLNNIIGNAVKYTPHYGKIDIRTRRKDTHIEVEVKDNGPGISDSDQRKMFQKFVRLSAQPTGNESSTGLGLYIVRKMCERLGMKIQVESALGNGTRIVLIQPLDTLPA